MTWNEEDPHAVEGLLIHLYTLEYPSWEYFQSCGIVRDHGTSNNASTLSKNMVITNPGHVTSLATHQGGSVAVPSTPTNAPQKFLKTTIPETHWRSAVKLFEIAERFNVVGLRELARLHLQCAIKKHAGKATYVALLEETWALEGKTANDLHNCVIEAIFIQMPLLLEEQEFEPMIERTSQIACCVFRDMQAEIERLRQSGRR